MQCRRGSSMLWRREQFRGTAHRSSAERHKTSGATRDLPELMSFTAIENRAFVCVGARHPTDTTPSNGLVGKVIPVMNTKSTLLSVGPIESTGF